MLPGCLEIGGFLSVFALDRGEPRGDDSRHEIQLIPPGRDRDSPTDPGEDAVETRRGAPNVGQGLGSVVPPGLDADVPPGVCPVLPDPKRIG